MIKLPKILSLLVIVSTIVIVFNILLPVCLAADATPPTPPSSSALNILDLQLPFGELPAHLSITGSTLAEYIKAVFLFGCAAVIILSLIMVMYGGVLWSISGAAPSTIEKAKDTIFKSLVGLSIALFSIMILQVVAPGTILLQPLSLTVLQGMKCCQLPGDNNYQLVTDVAAECTAKTGTIVSDGLCAGQLKDINLASKPPDVTAQCYGYTPKAECDKHADTCEWIDATAQCVAKNSKLSNTCWIVNKNNSGKGVCLANAKDNCVWLTNSTCLPNGDTKVEDVQNMSKICTTVENIKDASKCAQAGGGGGKCIYYNAGACDLQTAQAALKCADLQKQEWCPTTHCQWMSTSGWSWFTGSGICGDTGNWGSSCNTSDDCNKAIGFCCKNCPSAPNKCEPKLPPGACCHGLVAGTLLSNAEACSTGKCGLFNISITGECSFQCMYK